MTAPTTFIADANPDTHSLLVAGFAAAMLAVLPFDEHTAATHKDLEAMAAGFLDCLATSLAGLPEALTPAGRRKLSRAVGAEIEMTMERLLADPRRAHCLRTFCGDAVQ